MGQRNHDHHQVGMVFQPYISNGINHDHHQVGMVFQPEKKSWDVYHLSPAAPADSEFATIHGHGWIGAATTSFAGGLEEGRSWGQGFEHRKTMGKMMGQCRFNQAK